MPQCEGITKEGTRCKKTCQEGKTKCHVHDCEACPVCMSAMSEGSYRTLDCGHVFHARCLDRWKRRSSTCPMCRTPFDQPRYRVKITIEPEGFEHETITSNIQSLVDMFGLESGFFSTISFQVMNSTDMRTVLDDIGLIPPSVYFSRFNTES